MKESPTEPILYIVTKKAAPNVFWRGRTRQVGEIINISPLNHLEKRKLARYLAAGLFRVATQAEANNAIAWVIEEQSDGVGVPTDPSKDQGNVGEHARDRFQTDAENNISRQPDAQITDLQAEIRLLKNFVRIERDPIPDFGFLLRSLREAKRLGPNQFAEQCKCHPSLIYQIEYKKSANPQLSTIEKLATGLNMKASELIAAYEKMVVDFRASNKTVVDDYGR